MFHFPKATGGKEAIYEQLSQQVSALLEGENDWLANTTNASALLFQQLSEVNWAGFYFLQEDELILGPFQGKPACVRIPMGKGVCGTAAEERKSQVVPDVNAFPGHIACDPASRSEIVVPIFDGERLIGVLDIDSPVPNRFDEVDRLHLEKWVSILTERTYWPSSLGTVKEPLG